MLKQMRREGIRILNLLAEESDPTHLRYSVLMDRLGDLCRAMDTIIPAGSTQVFRGFGMPDTPEDDYDQEDD